MFFDALQVMRGLASLAVLLYHTNIYATLMGHNPHTVFGAFTQPFSYGAWMFFTLSGFLMASLIDRRYKSFLLRRVLRIYPSYVIASCLALVAKIMVFGSVTSPLLPRAMTLLPLGATVYPLGVEWTLIFEMCFYLVCAAFSWQYGRKAFPYFLGVWAAVILAVRGLVHVQYSLVPTMRNVLLEPFDLLFICGGLAFYLARWRGPQEMAHRVGEGVAGAVLIVVACFQESTFARCVLLGLGFAAIILAVLPWTVRPGNRLHAVLERLGDYSYGLYLAQAPVVTIIYAVAVDQYHMHLGSGVAVLAFLCAMATGIAMGALDVRLHVWSREWVKSWDARRAAAASARATRAPTGLAALAVCALGKGQPTTKSSP